MSGLKLQRLGLVMEPEPGNSIEEEGVLNPAAIRGIDGELYLFPRLVGRGNYSSIGIARVLFNDAGDPFGVERLGIALEPEADYELVSNGKGGCEDPRITFVEPLKCYLMTYTAFSHIGSRIALAISSDLLSWKRLGLAKFEKYCSIDFVNVNNKDASFFPVAIPNHAGKMQLAILHRPLFPGTYPEELIDKFSSRVLDIKHESIWISYCPIEVEDLELNHIGLFNSHHRLASPVSPWEQLKIGGGTATLIGDPPNIMIGSATDLNFMDFVKNDAPIAIPLLFLTTYIFTLIYKKKLVASIEVKKEIMKSDESKCIKDKKLLIKFIVVMGLIL